VVKKKSKKKKTFSKKFIVLLQVISIITLLLINFYLIYNVFSAIMPADSGVGKVVQADSLRADIQVEVLNGCGVSGVADKLTDYLRANNFDVVSIGNYRSFDIENSIIIDRTGKLSNADLIAESLGLNETNIIQQINKEYLLDVSIILGKDYLKLIPLKKRS
jgi:hypothetical protein